MSTLHKVLAIPRRATQLTKLLALRLLASAIVAGMLAGTSAAAEATPRWQPVPVSKADDHALVWAAGRVWFFNNGASDTGRFVTKSARVGNSGLASWVTATLGDTRG